MPKKRAGIVNTKIRDSKDSRNSSFQLKLMAATILNMVIPTCKCLAAITIITYSTSQIDSLSLPMFLSLPYHTQKCNSCAKIICII